MVQRAYNNSNQTASCIYDDIIKVAPQFQELRAEQIVKTHPLGEKFVVDGLALETRGSIEYSRLERELIGYIREFRSGQSYRSVAINEVGDRFLSILEYIGLLQRNFDTNPDKVENLTHSVIKTLIEKVGSVASFFIPKQYGDLYKKVEAKYLLEQARLREEKLKSSS